MNYKDHHTFPGGLAIHYESRVEKQYVSDRDAISNQAV